MDRDQRFWSLVNIGSPDECWPWIGPISNADGRGQFSLGTRAEGDVKAPRYAFFSVHGFWPVQANHLPVDCHNPNCCNPLHIYNGSARDNVLDAYADGHRHPWRLPPDVEQAVYDRYVSSDISQREVAKEFEIHQSTVHRIIRLLHGDLPPIRRRGRRRGRA